MINTNDPTTDAASAQGFFSLFLRVMELLKDLQGRNIEFVSLTEQINTTTPGGKLAFHLMGALAEFERDLIRERTHAGLAAARARGHVGGRPRKLKTKRGIFWLYEEGNLARCCQSSPLCFLWDLFLLKPPRNLAKSI